MNKKKKNKDKNKINLFSKSSYGFLNFGKKEKKEEKNQDDIAFKHYNSTPQYNFNPIQQVQQTPQMNYTPNGFPQNYNSFNQNQIGFNQMYPQQQNYNTIGVIPNASSQMYYSSNNMTPMGNPGTIPMGNPGTTPIESLQEPIPMEKNKSPFSFFGKKSAISKKTYSKIKPEDLKIVLLYMKNSNNKYQEGLDLCGRRQYYEAQTCFAQARASYMNLNKIMNGNPKAYPTEFRMVISQKINEKLALVYQSIKECSTFIRTKNTDQMLKNPEKAQDILRNININKNNNDFNNFNNKDLNSINNNNLDNNNQNKKKKYT